MRKKIIFQSKVFDLQEAQKIIGIETASGEKELLLADQQFILKDEGGVHLLPIWAARYFLQMYRAKIAGDRFNFISRVFFNGSLPEKTTMLPHACNLVATAAGESLHLFSSYLRWYLSADGETAASVSRKGALNWLERHQREIADFDNVADYFAK